MFDVFSLISGEGFVLSLRQGVAPQSCHSSNPLTLSPGLRKSLPTQAMDQLSGIRTNE